MLVATSATQAELSRSDSFKKADLPIGRVDPQVIQVLYQVDGLPLLFAVDGSGRIQAKGVVSHGKAVEKILTPPDEKPMDARRAARRRTFTEEVGTDDTPN